MLFLIDNFRKGLFIIILLIPVWLTAQVPNLKFKHIGVSEGLSQVSVRCILQDSESYMWFGTDYGLNKYDGYKITVYKNDTRIPGSISNDIIVCIYEDRKKNLWIGTLNGLNRYDREHDKFTTYLHNPNDSKSISGNGIQSIYEDREGTLWISTFNVLTNKGIVNAFDYANGGFLKNPHEINFSKGTSNNIVNCFFEEENGNLWLGLNNGLSYYDKTKKTFKYYNPISESGKGISGKSVNAIIEDNNGKLWIASDFNGLSVFDRKSQTFKNYTYNPNNPSGLGSNQVFTLLLDNSGNIWVAVGDGGLHLYNPQNDNFIHYTNDEKDPNSISQDMVRTLYQDRNGIIWVGIFKSGINYFKIEDQTLEHYKKDLRPNSLSANKVRTFCEDSDGNIWVGTDGGGLNKFYKQRNSFIAYKPSKNPDSIGSDAVLDVFEDSYHNLWVGTWAGGLNLFNKKTNNFTHYYHNDNDATSLSSNNVSCIIEDHSRNLWAATFSEGLNVLNREKNNFIRVPCFLKNEKSRISCMSIDADGFIWVGTNSSGIGVLDPHAKKFIQQFQRDSKVTGSISSDGIYNLFADSKNRIWIGTDKGLNLYNASTHNFTTWRTTDGLIHDVVVGIIEDEKGYLWISTLGGVTKFDPETKAFSNFSVLDEFQENKFLEGSCMMARDGLIYFGGINGFNIFHPASIKKNRTIPPIYFTDFQIFNKSVKVGGKDSPLSQQISQTKQLELTYKQSVISFEFTALNYVNSKKNQYAYKLEGFDDNWNYIGTKRTASYTNLNAGKYILKVKASNDDEVWNEKGASIKLIITPPFWKTWWAYVFYLIVIITALYFFREYSIIQIKVRNKLIIEHLENKKLNDITEAKMRFFTNISHEIRTPLTLISGPLERVLKEHEVSDVVKKDLSSVNKNVKRLLGLVNQLLQFRKLDLGFLHLNASETSIVLLLTELLEYFEHHAALKNVDIVIVNQLGEEKNLWLDREMITTVFYNLLANAIKYTQPGGHIYVRIFESSIPKTALFDKIKRLLSSNNKKDSIAVEVNDTGKGIETRELKNIFKRFYQVNDSSDASGSGLGLSLVKEYVELHKGFIEVHSKVQHGTSFTIYFPKELKIQKSKSESLNIETNNYNIVTAMMEIEKSQTKEIEHNRELPLVLIVEDDDELLNYLRESLLKSFRVEVANNGKVGLEKALSIFPDLIISDIAMPEMDGYNLCKEIKSNVTINHIPVMLLTAKAADDNIVLGYNYGADAYIPKPFNINVVESQGKSLIKSRELLRQKYRNLMIIEPAEIKRESPDEKFLKQLMEITDANIEKPTFDVPMLVAEMGMSRSPLFRKMKALTGLSLIDYLKTARLKRAAAILRSGKVKITDVSSRVGFSDISYFSKCFTKEFGKTPSEYINEYHSRQDN